MSAGLSGQAFLAAAAAGRKALVGYLPVGFPDFKGSLAALRVLCGDEHPGVDLVEIGLPYTDPMMDGPVIQAAGTKALARGVRTRDVFSAVETVRAAGRSAVVMTYWNLVEHYSVAAFARDLANAGGAGLITPDLIPEEAEAWLAASDEYGLDRIFLVSPSSSDERIIATTAACRGWVYATSVMGVTGTRSKTSSAAPELVARIRQLAPETLVGVGLGVTNGNQAAEVAAFADAVIVGSAFIKPLLAADTELSNPSQQLSSSPGLETPSSLRNGLAQLQTVLEDLTSGVRR